MEPRNISTQVNYSLRPHVYWLNTFGHLSKKKEEEEKITRPRCQVCDSPLRTYLDNTRGQHSETHLHVYWLKGRKRKVVQHHHRWISFFIFPPLFYRWFFLSVTQQRCVYVAADCWEFNLIFFRGLWWMGYQGLH